jgi:large subunit ribosomal protein L4
MEFPVKNTKGEQVDTIQVADSVFSTPMNQAVVHQAMVSYHASLRQGTHSTKTRHEVSGGGRKPWKQKHTGRARQGSTRSPQWRHGGIVFGPHPRSYRVALPQKMRRQALLCVLSEKARSNKLTIVDKLTVEGAKSKEMVGTLKGLRIVGSTLIVTNGKDEMVARSARNLPGVFTLPVDLLNAGILLRKENLLMTTDAVRRAEALWSVRKAVSEKEEGA